MSAGLDAGLGADGGGRNRGWTLAIDFGTSNTSASWRDDVGNVREVRLGSAGNLMPSAVFAGPEGLVVGDLAIRSAQADPGAFEPAPKRRLAEMSVPLGGRTLSGDSLASAVLADVLQRAVRVTGSQPAEVVLTYPDRWDTELQHLLVQAAVAAGIPANQVRLLSEARAAAWFYTGWGTPPAAGERIGVFDFGAGTCDVAVLEKQPDGSFTVLAAEGVDGLGGRDFDGRVWQWVRGQLASAAPELLAELDSPAGVRGRLMVMDRIREAKETLSGLSSATIVAHGRLGEMVLSLTRGEFEEIIADDVEEAVALAERVFGTTGAPHRLFLTGGSSLIPLVHAELGRLAPVAELGDPQTVVSQGALRAPLSAVESVATKWAGPEPLGSQTAESDDHRQPGITPKRSAGAVRGRKRGAWKGAAAMTALVAVIGGVAWWGLAPSSTTGEQLVADAVKESDETVFAWGGKGSKGLEVPGYLSPDKNIVKVATGGYHSLALSSGGTVFAWGPYGSKAIQEPVVELDDKKIIDIAAGERYSLALDDKGIVHGWGNFYSGQDVVPAELADRNIVAIAAGWGHALALAEDGTVSAWGNNMHGQATVPADLSGRVVVGIAAGQDNSMALLDDGTILGWGSDQSGQLNAPSELSSQKVVAIAAGGAHSLALTDNGVVYAWGSDSDGRSTIPAEMSGKKIMGIAAGNTHSLAFDEDGNLYSWGSNLSGQTDIPESLAGKKVVGVAAGASNSLAITAD